MHQRRTAAGQSSQFQTSTPCISRFTSQGVQAPFDTLHNQLTRPYSGPSLLPPAHALLPSQRVRLCAPPANASPATKAETGRGSSSHSAARPAHQCSCCLQATCAHAGQQHSKRCLQATCAHAGQQHSKRCLWADCMPSAWAAVVASPPGRPGCSMPPHGTAGTSKIRGKSRSEHWSRHRGSPYGHIAALERLANCMAAWAAQQRTVTATMSSRTCAHFRRCSALGVPQPWQRGRSAAADRSRQGACHQEDAMLAANIPLPAQMASTALPLCQGWPATAAVHTVHTEGETGLLKDTHTAAWGLPRCLRPRLPPASLPTPAGAPQEAAGRRQAARTATPAGTAAPGPAVGERPPAPAAARAC